MAIIDTVLRYAEKANWHLHPCKVNKHPLLDKWPDRATSDPETLKQLWQEFPNASIGLACGPKSGVWVLDVDLPDGPEALRQLEGKYGELPDTLVQTTGSGGVQYFWKWNGTPIRNSSRKIGEGLDVRGRNGYVIIPPSSHPSGNQYKWKEKRPIASPPAWLVQLIQNQKKPQNQKSYGEAALASELADLARSSLGQRNDTLNTAAYSLGQLVAGGELDHGAVSGALLGVAISIGLPEKESRATIESGMRAGALQPRTGKDNDFGQLTDSDIDSVITCHPVSSGGSESQHLVSTLSSSCHQSVINSGYSLAERMQDWILNSPGSFSNNDIDREFCLTTRGEKNNRAKILSRLYMARKIKKDKRKKGVWYVVNQDIEFIDLDAEEPESFPISFPFGLHEYVMIPPKAIILLAGSSNAGKTAFILNALRMNLKQDYGLFYLMSEMGSGEYKTRIKKFGDGIAPWKKISAASVSYDFDGIISDKNRDGLSCIDYLEEVAGEYFKIPTDIRNIYDALGNGVALVAIQKRTDQDYARGGQGTVEKARLVMNLDYLCSGERCIYCALKLVKVKHFLGRNLQGHEIHFKLENGCQITPISDWMLSSKTNRIKCATQYEAGIGEPDGEDIYFITVEGERVRVIARDLSTWEENFQNIDVRKEVFGIAQSNMKKRFLKKKDYFFQLSAMLTKKNNGGKK